MRKVEVATFFLSAISLLRSTSGICTKSFKPPTMPAPVMAAAGLYILAREPSSKKAGKEEAEPDQKRPRHSEDSCYASSPRSTSIVQRTDSILPDKEVQPTYSRDVLESPTSLSDDPQELDQTASACYSSPTEISGSTTSDVHAVRVRTKGNDLKSGFPYHPGLYDLRVRPDGKS